MSPTELRPGTSNRKSAPMMVQCTNRRIAVWLCLATRICVHSRVIVAVASQQSVHYFMTAWIPQTVYCYFWACPFLLFSFFLFYTFQLRYRLSWLISAFERTLKWHVSYRIVWQWRIGHFEKEGGLEGLWVEAPSKVYEWRTRWRLEDRAPRKP